ncbi:ATP-dependent DNA helicase RecG [Patescibacteria group bacterium]|nr:ATP-dependent DNA helicase RecG [Patescibacteria group bacterium]MBU1907090.1 ATP-dependent DNA helicase RecG [Patescibacteria group bacterium]
MYELGDQVSVLPGIGPAVAKDMKKLGIETVRDLLLYFPFRYEDLSKVVEIESVVPGELNTIQGRVVTIKAWRSPKKRMFLTEAIVEDETGKIKVIWFNQPYLAKSLRPGTMVSLSGRVDDKYGVSLVNPIYEIVRSDETVHTGRIIPIYPLTGSLTSKRLRAAIHSALESIGQLVEWLPLEIREAENLFELPNAIRAIHYPASLAENEKAIERLKFDELFLHQIMFARARADQVKLPAYQIARDQDAEGRFLNTFAFELTGAQARSVDEILADMDREHPMNRLLEGDVGSGKSAVAACAIEQCVRNGFQAAYLAPTEILAKQQYIELAELLPKYRVALLTRSGVTSVSLSANDDLTVVTPNDKQEFKQALASGQIDLVVATHAILQEGYSFEKLGLLVIDEQHRFGVRQRQELMNRVGPIAPHLLSMSATPIPRSLALSIYGDLDISILDELPAGRKPILTHLVDDRRPNEAWRLMSSEIENGHQVYTVCPLIDPSDKLGATSVTEFAAELKSGPLGKYRIEILHGKLKPADKAEVIQRFVAGEIDILVSTTVVEVGVNVPNATVMYIEGADRFGLAQLHQLRGRVGRSDLKSYCLLHSNSSSQHTIERLEAVVNNQDGFALAEKDLELRGSGNLFGTEQSGFIDFKLATFADVEIMKKARDWANKIMENGLGKYDQLSEKVDAEYLDVHFE